MKNSHHHITRQQRGRRAWQVGRFAEHLVLLWLVLQGYRLLARNWRTPVGEIDLLMRRDHTLLLIEVKYRPTAAAAAMALQPTQQQRLARAARYALVAHANWAQSCELRLITLAPWGWPQQVTVPLEPA